MTRPAHHWLKRYPRTWRAWLDSHLDDVSVWKKGVAIVIIPLVALLLTLVLLASYEKTSLRAQEAVRHSLQVKAQLYRVQSIITDSETAVRGYLLWRDPAYLRPYEISHIQLPGAMAQLLDLVKDDAGQTSAARTLQKVARKKVKAMSAMVSDPLSARLPQNVNTRLSFSSMGELRQLLKEMEVAEDTILHQRILRHDQTISRLNWLLILLLLLALLCGTAASYIVWTGLLARINRLEVYARQVSRGQTARWDDTGQDELAMLGRSVQVMTNNLLAREESLQQTRSELQRANARLTSQLRETQAVNEELETFSYSVSHDLRAPLRHVAGFGELMQKNSDDLSQKNQRYLGIILTSVQQMGVLIDQLLAFSRMGRTALHREAVDLNDVVGQVLTNLSAALQDRPVEWKVDHLPTVPGDPVMLRLVFQNLLDNAVKYTRERDPAIISVEEEPSPLDGMVRIVVADNGMGFDNRQAEKLFAVFQRLHNSEEYEGSGIGLATVRRIILRHGGDISASGTPGQGARFCVDLPKNPVADRTN